MPTNFPACYDPASERRIVTPSPFARKNLLYLQEAGHIKLRQSHAGTTRSALNSYLIVAVAAGSGTLWYGGLTHTLRTGQCFWVDCRRPHSYRPAPDDPWELRWVHYNGQSAPAYHGLFTERQGAGPVFTPPDFDALLKPMDEALAAARAWDATAELSASAALATLLALILKGLAQGDAAAQSAPAAARLDDVHAWLAAHAAEPVTLDELAAKFYISKYHLTRTFKQRYGETIFTYINAVRLDAAKQMLRYTDCTLSEIAARCGFHDQSYFTRRFRQAEGQTAKEYRQEWKGRTP